MKTAAAATLKKQLGALAHVSDAERKDAALAICRPWLTEQRANLKEAFFASGNAEELIENYAKVIDELLAGLFACAPLPKTKALKMTVVAIGGYGRSELFPYSDIDILFLYEKKQDAAAAKLTEFILYVLWDLGLKVGQAHRSVADALSLAKKDMTIRTTMLDARPVAGNGELFESFFKRFQAEIMEGSELAFVEAKLAERDGRHGRFGDSRYMLEPNVKEGKGGLRDLHTLWWLARYSYPIHTLADLVEMGLLTEDEYRSFNQARQFLWQVRAWLHYLSERAEERLTFDKQHAIAEKMGFPHPSINRSIARFMRRYFVAVRTVGSMTRIFCALLEDEKKRKPRRALPWLSSAPWRLAHFRLDGERINIRIDYAFEQQPLLMLEMFHVAQEYGLDIHPRALRLVGQNLRLIDEEFRSNPKACAVFLNILLSKKDPEVTLRRMSESGLLGRFIPDFARVVGQTQFNMYHVYTVDEHTLVAVGMMHALENGELKKEAPLATELFPRITMRRALYLAIFCHDIGKGQGGDHSYIGEKVIEKLAARFGLAQDEIEMAAWLVRHHLLFSNTAFKRDLNDPKTITDFVEMVQSPERMRLLLILTVADIRAVGPAVWNEWKGSLMRDLYTRAEQAMGTGSVQLKHQEEDEFREKLTMLLPGWKAEELGAYIEQCSASFMVACDLPHHAAIARMLRQIEHAKEPLVLDTRHDAKRSITEIIICTPDQHGLFSKMTGALALAGANIINAKIFTLKSGMAVEIFQVQDASGALFDRPDRLAKLAVYLEQALSGNLNISAQLAQRGKSYLATDRSAVAVVGQAFIDNTASNIHTVLEITGHDRVGFLYDVTRVIAEQGLSIVTAHITTYGTQAVDVFYVKDIFGMKLLHEAKQKQVREALLNVVGNR
ncbi:MAG: [protein-PII] uridylyltransferase [Alphaproteobacteria bacterium]|nr:[protein-PII] uridylyltransferase [Alphaproteobacteria bacterium]